MRRVTYKGVDIEVRELTVEQLETILADAAAPTIIDRLFDADLVTERMLMLCTGLDAEELRRGLPSELRPLVEAVKEVNPDFLSALGTAVSRAPVAG